MNKRVVIVSAATLAVFVFLLILNNLSIREAALCVSVEENLEEYGAHSFIKDVKLKMICDKKIGSTSIISKAYGFKKLPQNIEKIIGEPLYIKSTAKYRSANITINYDTLQIDTDHLNKVVALRYDDKMQRFEVLKTKLDKDDNSLSFKTSHLGEFLLAENDSGLKTGDYIGELTYKSNSKDNEIKVGNHVYDVVVYGGTSAGVIAACKAARLGLSVILVSKDMHLGGMSSSGLSLTDVNDDSTIGGMAKEYYLRGLIYYFKKFESNNGYNLREKKELFRIKKCKTIEPHVAESIFNELIKEENVPVLYGHRLDLNAGVEVHNKSIQSIKTEFGDIIKGKIFIDASYEGDLMAKAGLSYAVGREGNTVYDERNNGIQYMNSSSSQQLPLGIDPYVDKNNPGLGLINGIKELSTEDGVEDKGIQAYCFRMCLTDNISNMVDYIDENGDGIRDYVEPPPNYNKNDYELLLRYIEVEKNGRLSEDQFNNGHNTFFCLDRLPNDKIDANNCGPVSIDYIGLNHSYPEAGYELRESIMKRHEDYQRGFLWTIQFSDDPRIPDYIKNFYRKFGLAKDEFKDNNNWPYQLYIREGRRLVSDYVMTEHNFNGTRVAEDSIGLASYPMDSHNIQRYVHTYRYAKHIQNEGCILVKNPSKSSWPISYRSIIPKRGECKNILVPVALSASHTAYGSIRMEPTFMIMAESAVEAAKIAIEENSCLIHDVSYQKLKRRLLLCGQILE